MRPRQLIDDYLKRLRLQREPPSADALRRLHRAHVERVPYETVWIHTGEHYGCSAEESFARIASTTRGGYCFHLNGAFSHLLYLLGYHVIRHVGGVHGPDGPTETLMTNHLALTAHGLPAEDNPYGDWYVDVGLGDALYEPLPLRSGVYQQPPFRLELTEAPGRIGDWHLLHDPKGSFFGMAWWSAPSDMEVFEATNTNLSTSPESGFVRTLSVQRRSIGAVDILRGLVLLRVGESPGARTLESYEELKAALHGVFGFDLNDFPAGSLDTLWDRAHAAHTRRPRPSSVTSALTGLLLR